MKKAILIDDEAKARQVLRDFLTDYCPTIKIMGEADGVQSALKSIRQLRPDLVFLDIQMKDGTGFDLLDKFSKLDFNIIFTTAFDEFAIKAFKYSAIDYLLKPISIEELIQAVDKVMQREIPMISSSQLSNLKTSNRTKQLNRLVLSSSEGLHFVELSEIIRLQSEGNYTTFYLNSGERILVAKGLKVFEELLPKTQFFRSHQSNLVQLSFVKKILREDGGYALTKDGAKVPVSRSKKNELLSILTNF